MDALLSAPPANRSSFQETRSDEAVRTQVRHLLSALYPPGELAERRSSRRYPYPYLVYLTPVGADGVTAEGASIVVVGKHLSDQGFGFYHPKPLPFRRVIATLEATNGVRLGFLVDLTWCRFTRHGWYESGGRFLQAVPSPLANGVG